MVLCWENSVFVLLDYVMKWIKEREREKKKDLKGEALCLNSRWPYKKVGGRASWNADGVKGDYRVCWATSRHPFRKGKPKRERESCPRASTTPKSPNFDRFVVTDIVMLAPFHTLRPTYVQTVSSIPVRKEVKEEEEKKRGEFNVFHKNTASPKGKNGLKGILRPYKCIGKSRPILIFPLPFIT